MWVFYILLCDNRTYYVGVSTNIPKRISEHTLGQSQYTKRFKSIKLVYYEFYDKEEGALRREQQVKKWSRKKKELLIDGVYKKIY